MIFAEHNVLSDPPFSRVQLVSCRNLLIYLDRAAQQEALESFHFAMRPGGYLFLGSSETVDATSRLFTPVDKARRIYRANPVARPNRPLEPRLRDSGRRSPCPGRRSPPRRGRRRRPTSTASCWSSSRRRPCSPPRQARSSTSRRRASRYLRYAAGEPSHAVVQAVPGDLRQPLRTALAQVNQIEDRVDAEAVRTMIDGRPGAGADDGAAGPPSGLAVADAADLVRRVPTPSTTIARRAPPIRPLPSSRTSCSGATSRCARRSSSTRRRPRSSRPPTRSCRRSTRSCARRPRSSRRARRSCSRPTRS